MFTPRHDKKPRDLAAYSVRFQCDGILCWAISVFALVKGNACLGQECETFIV